MSDQDDTQPSERPPERPTVKFDPPPKWAEGMFSRVHEGINAMEARFNTRLDEQGTKLDQCVSGLGTVTNEMERVKKEFYEHKGNVDARLDSNSMRAKQESVHDDEQDKKIAQLSESQMAALLKAAAKTPTGQKVVNAMVLLVLAALGYGTFWLTTHRPAPQSPAVMIQENSK